MFIGTSDTDRQLQRGFIDKNDVLQVLSQEEIFSLVFGFLPEEHSYVRSPLRNDNNSGCWFEYSSSGVLKLIDYADNSFADCFECVQRFYRLPSFYHTLRFIEDNSSILLSKRSLDYQHKQPLIKPRTDTRFVLETRDFQPRDIRYWSQFGITIENLEQDYIKPVKTIYISSWRKDSVLRERTISYSLGLFNNNRVKVYRPLSTRRFLTNCISDDIGMVTSVDFNRQDLIISKSYKDCRVLRNLGYNSIWVQSEVIRPSDQVIKSVFGKFKYITVFFDNDETGIRNSHTLAEHIRLTNKCECKSLHLPVDLRRIHITDPAEMYQKRGQKELQTFLTKELQWNAKSNSILH